MYYFLTQSRKIKLGMILLIMSLLTIMPVLGVNSAPPQNGSELIKLEGVVSLPDGGMAIEDQILAFGTQCDLLAPPLTELKRGDMSWMKSNLKWHHYLPAGTSVEQMVDKINQLQGIDCTASPNYLTYLSSNYSVFGSPFEGYGANADPQDIQNQSTLSIVNPAISATGLGVTVAMFDSYCQGTSQNHLQNSGFGSIDYQGDYATHIPATFHSPGPPPNLCPHGEGVASMLRTMAPGTDIKLYRVFGKNGFGTLSDLIEALNHFAQGDIPRHTIINLSLGVKASRNDDVPILKDVLEGLYKRNVLIVAAAGNERLHAPTQYPAAYDFVIGVAATNHNDEQASYANDGNTRAPGGDGECGKANTDAIDANKKCLAVLNSQSEETGASYWKGSSFSAGIVSGAAALLWEAGPTLSPTKIKHLIQNGANSNEVIDVQHSLNLCQTNYPEQCQ